MILCVFRMRLKLLIYCYVMISKKQTPWLVGHNNADSKYNARYTSFCYRQIDILSRSTSTSSWRKHIHLTTSFYNDIANVVFQNPPTSYLLNYASAIVTSSTTNYTDSKRPLSHWFCLNNVRSLILTLTPHPHSSVVEIFFHLLSLSYVEKFPEFIDHLIHFFSQEVCCYFIFF